jgi:hypothetical protein
MSSEARINASRANGALSRGPVTEEGKRNSSKNSTTHWLLSNTVVIEGENPDRFAALHDTMIAEIQPRTEIESTLVDSMTVFKWKQRRVWGMETAELNDEIHRQFADAPEVAAKDAPVRAATAFRNLCDNSRSLDVPNRYDVRFERQFHRALRQLIELRSRANLGLVD